MALRVVSGKATVVTPGTPVPLSATPLKAVRVYVNCVDCALGGANTSFANNIGVFPSAGAHLIEGGHSADGGLLDLSELFVDSDTAGKYACFTALCG